MKTLARLALLVLVVLLLPRCDDTSDNYLDGSLTDTYSFDFASVRVRFYEGSKELSVEYVESGGDGEKVTLRMTIDASTMALGNNKQYDLLQVGTIGRGEGYNNELPELNEGSFTLEEYSGKDGSPVSGAFRATFLKPDQSVLSLRGGFAGKLKVISASTL